MPAISTLDSLTGSIKGISGVMGALTIDPDVVNGIVCEIRGEGGDMNAELMVFWRLSEELVAINAE